MVTVEKVERAGNPKAGYSDNLRFGLDRRPMEMVVAVRGVSGIKYHAPTTDTLSPVPAWRTPSIFRAGIRYQTRELIPREVSGIKSPT
jgi:hypothetical protein